MKNYKYIIFIDDDLASNYYHEYILRDTDWVEETSSFLSPQKALKYFQGIEAGSGDKIPDILFVDINMPQMNGFEFIEAYSKLNLPEQALIIVMSTTINPNDSKRCEDDPHIFEFLNKPLTLEYLKQLKNKRSLKETLKPDSTFRQ